MPTPANTSTRGNNQIIAMLVDQISDPFLAEFARRLDRKARSMGYKLVFGNTENDIRFTTKLISVFHNMNVAGYIIAPPAGMDLDLRKLLTRGRPVVLFDTDHPDSGVYHVSSDNYQGGYDAVAHLVAGGYRNIGFLTPLSGPKRIVDRRRGYHQAIEDLGLEPHVAELPDSASPEIIEAAIKDRPFDSLIFADNNIAFTGMGVLRQLKLQAPRDLAVIGFDDNDYFSLFSPGITAVTQPLNEMVEKILQCIITHPAANAQTAKQITLPTRFITRQSSTPAPTRRRNTSTPGERRKAPAASMFSRSTAKLSQM